MKLNQILAIVIIFSSSLSMILSFRNKNSGSNMRQMDSENEDSFLEQENPKVVLVETERTKNITIKADKSNKNHSAFVETEETNNTKNGPKNHTKASFLELTSTPAATHAAKPHVGKSPSAPHVGKSAKKNHKKTKEDKKHTPK